MASRHSLLFLCSVLSSFTTYAAVDRGFADDKQGSNVALLVAVGHGLSGLNHDLRMAEEVVTHPEYNFAVTRLEEEQGTVAAIEGALTHAAEAANDDGTLLFFYTGHGAEGLIWPQDNTMTVQQIRQAIEDGRRNRGPLKRLVLIYDSCHAGSMMDPMNLLPFPSNAVASAAMADAVVRELSAPSRDGRNYWEKLIVLASSQADETSLASPDGSIFTLAFKKAFDESIQTNDTFGAFFKKAQDYTKGHHPVARWVPASLVSEKLIP